MTNNGSKLTRKFGDKVARKIQLKLTQLRAFNNLSEVPTRPPFSRHNLHNDFEGCVAIDAVGRRDSVRIVLQPIDNERNIVSVDNLKIATGVIVIFVGDYH